MENRTGLLTQEEIEQIEPSQELNINIGKSSSSDLRDHGPRRLRKDEFVQSSHPNRLHGFS